MHRLPSADTTEGVMPWGKLQPPLPEAQESTMQPTHMPQPDNNCIWQPPAEGGSCPVAGVCWIAAALAPPQGTPCVAPPPPPQPRCERRGLTVGGARRGITV